MTALTVSWPDLARNAPWNERNGRLNPLRAIVFAALFVPAAYILYLLAAGALQPKPVTELIHRTGDWAVRLTLISLLITPLRKLAQWAKVIAVRRMVGVAAFAYAFAHFCLYIVDQNYDLWKVVTEIALRFYLTIGFVALLGLGALAATSTEGMVRRLGAQRWNQLHKTIYVLAALALFHYYLQSKADVSDPVLMTGMFFMLMLYRVLQKRLPLWATAALSVVLGVAATAFAEAAWYTLRRGYPFWDVLGANIDPDMFPRPTFWVAVAGGAALAVYAMRAWQERRNSSAALKRAVGAAPVMRES